MADARTKRIGARRRPLIALAMVATIALIGVPNAVATPTSEREPTVREKVCRYHLPVAAEEPFALMTLPAPRGGNVSGVLLLVNCSARQVVSVRDPSHSPQHVAEWVYDALMRGRLPKDSYGYEALNFNKPEHNTGIEHVLYGDNVGWRGPCLFKDLQLTTIDPRNPRDRRTKTFSVNICTNQVLALLAPPVAMSTANDSRGVDDLR